MNSPDSLWCGKFVLATAPCIRPRGSSILIVERYPVAEHLYLIELSTFQPAIKPTLAAPFAAPRRSMSPTLNDPYLIPFNLHCICRPAFVHDIYQTLSLRGPQSSSYRTAPR